MPIKYSIAEGPPFKQFIFRSPIFSIGFICEMRLNRLLDENDERGKYYPLSGKQKVIVTCVGRRPCDENPEKNMEDNYFFVGHCRADIPALLKTKRPVATFLNFYLIGTYNTRTRLGNCCCFSAQERAFEQMKKGALGYLLQEHFSMGDSMLPN